MSSNKSQIDSILKKDKNSKLTATKNVKITPPIIS